MPSMEKPMVDLALTGWSVARPIPGGIELKHPHAICRITVLARDLIRVQVARDTAGFERRSIAVDKTEWTPIETIVERSGSRVRIGFAGGQFTMDRRTGHWMLESPTGKRLFETTGRPMGWEQLKARCTLRLETGEALFGLGETTGQHDRRGLVRDFWNIDVLGHAPAIHPGLKQLYVSIPFALCWKSGVCCGLFWDNVSRQVWDMGQAVHDAWHMSAALDGLDLYLFTGPTVESVTTRYSELTGRTPMPPRWALGYHQSRYSYETAAEVLRIAREFRRRKLPCDALYLDIHHMDGYRVFTFGAGFPQPKSLMQSLAKWGFHTVAIVDPGVKNDPRFGVLRRGVGFDAFVKQSDGVTDLLGEVWPGESRFPDFLNPSVRAWWGNEQRTLLEAGIDGIWNDMNEPANFARPDKTLPLEAIHRAPWGAEPHERMHNAYGMAMAQASHEGFLNAPGYPGQRPFVVTRAGYAGVQRFGVVWTGDTSSNWDHLHDAVQMLCNLSLSGVPFCGADVGGFLENAGAELFVRWFQFAAFTPFFRSHTNIGTARQEPWAFGSEVEGICRRHLELRSRWMPWWYCLLADAHRTGRPVLRPLFWLDPSDETAVRCGDQFLVGDSVLVAPILRQGARARSVYLPTGTWHDYWTGVVQTGQRHILAEAPLDRIPLYIRAGSIIPTGPLSQSTSELAPSTMDLNLWLGGEGSTLWWEEETAPAPGRKVPFYGRTCSVVQNERGHLLVLAAAEGALKSNVRSWRIRIHGAVTPPRASVHGRELVVRSDTATGHYQFTVANSPRSIEIQLLTQ